MSAFDIFGLKSPAPGSVEDRLACRDIEAAREYLQAFVDDGASVEWGRVMQAVTLLLVELDRRTP
jgi:hypothetical protein